MNIQWKVAGRLLEAKGRKPEEHTILRENVTHLLTQFKPEYVESLDALPTDKMEQALNGSYANGPVHLAQKLSRDLRQRPYTDEEVFKRLDELDAALKAETARILENSKPYPCKFYIAGSLEKGRFGARSDVDVLCQASPELMKANKWNALHSDLGFQYMDVEEPQMMVDAFAPTREVTPEEINQPGFLRSLFVESMERKGYAVEDGHLVPQGPIQREVEVPPEASKHIMWTLPMV